MTMLPEVESYVERLNAARSKVLKTLEGLPPEGLNWSPLPADANSVYALATHCLGAERRWLFEVVGKQKIERDRPAEFRARGEEISPLRDAYAGVARESEAILGRLGEPEMADLRGDAEKHTVRWCILHVVEHYNEHLGQMSLTRQLWENRGARPHEI